AIASGTVGWFAQRILIHFNDFIVSQKTQSKIIKPGNIATEDQRRGEQTPERDMRVLFVRGEWGRSGLALPVAKKSKQHVIGIIRPAWTTELVELVAFIDVETVSEDGRGYAFKSLAKVTRGSPTIAANFFAPFPYVAHAVLAEVEDNVAVLVTQNITHLFVRFLQSLTIGIFGKVAIGTPIVFEEIEAPLGKALSVKFLMLVSANMTGASERAWRRIDSRLQTFCMDIIGECLHVWKASVRVDFELRIARLATEVRVVAVRFNRPTIVNVHVLVAMIDHAAAGHRISSV